MQLFKILSLNYSLMLELQACTIYCYLLVTCSMLKIHSNNCNSIFQNLIWVYRPLRGVQ